MSERTARDLAIGFSKESELWPRKDEPAVRAELASRFLAYAKSIGIRYRGRAESTEDLVQVASVGLMNAIDRFDPDRGLPFLAFASPTIHGEMKRHFRDRVSAMRVPRSVYDRIGVMDSVVSDLRASLSHEPDVAEIAEAMNCSQGEVLEARDATQVRNPEAFGSGAGDDAGVPEGHLGRVDANYELAEDRMVTGEAMSNLDREDRTILTLRFRDEMTQLQIADRMGCSQMQISRRLRSILDSLTAATSSVAT